MLSDKGILRAQRSGELKVFPWRPELVSAASLDVTLYNKILVQIEGGYIDPGESSGNWLETESQELPQIVGGVFIHPGDFMLGCTQEIISLPDNMTARIEGKSSLARLGLLTHVTAGFIDPGFTGQITLELKNVGTTPILLVPGMKIAQLCFIPLDEAVKNPYGSNGSMFQGQLGPQPSRGHEKFSTYHQHSKEEYDAFSSAVTG